MNTVFYALFCRFTGSEATDAIEITLKVKSKIEEHCTRVRFQGQGHVITIQSICGM